MASDEKDAQGEGSFVVNQQYTPLALVQMSRFVSQPQHSPDLRYLVSRVCCGQQGKIMTRRCEQTPGRALAVGHSVRLFPAMSV